MSATDAIFKFIFRLLYLDSQFTEIYSKGSNQQRASIRSVNGFLLNRQAIFFTNDALVYWRIFVSLGLDELRDHYLSCS